MLRLIVITLLFYSTIAESNTNDTRIIGGDDAKLGEIPYIVSLLLNSKHMCGGSIINERFVLTAAHCISKYVDSPKLLTVLYGGIEINFTSMKRIEVAKIIKHEKYVEAGSFPNDIALLQVNGKFTFNSNAQPVQLPTVDENVATGANLLLAGWGYTTTTGAPSRNLKKVIIQRFSDEYCQADSNYDPSYHICAGKYGGGKGQCSGDSGGPLTLNGKQFGVVSWSNKPCASPGKPGVFTKVSNYRDWIKKHAGV